MSTSRVDTARRPLAPTAMTTPGGAPARPTTPGRWARRPPRPRPSATGPLEGADRDHPRGHQGQPERQVLEQRSGPPSSPAAAWMSANAAPATTSSTAATRPAACLDRGGASTISVICPPIAPRQCSTRAPLIQEPLWNVRRVAEAGGHDAEDGRGAAPDRAGRRHRADGRAGRPAPPDPALAGRAAVDRGPRDGRAAGGQDRPRGRQRQPPPQAAAPAGLHRARTELARDTRGAGGGPRRATSAGASRTSSPTASAAGSPTRRRWRTSATRSARSRRG